MGFEMFGKRLQDYIHSHPKRQDASQYAPTEPQTLHRENFFSITQFSLYWYHITYITIKTKLN
jgi:hypothetical protein